MSVNLLEFPHYFEKVSTRFTRAKEDTRPGDGLSEGHTCEWQVPQETSAATGCGDKDVDSSFQAVLRFCVGSGAKQGY